MRNTLRTAVIFCVFIFSANKILRAQPYPYQDSSLSVEKRVDDLISRMTIEDKFWQIFMVSTGPACGAEKIDHSMFGLQVFTEPKSKDTNEQILRYSPGKSAKDAAIEINRIQKHFTEDTSPGIPLIFFDEALHGLVRKGATAFPQAIGLAAAFDIELMSKAAGAIAEEVRSRGIRMVLSPVVNIARDVRWGRVEETYGEDPLLCVQMAAEQKLRDTFRFRRGICFIWKTG